MLRNKNNIVHGSRQGGIDAVSPAEDVIGYSTNSKTKNARSSYPLVAVLGILIAIIVGLTAVIVVNYFRGDYGTAEDDVLSFPEVDCSNPKSNYAVQTCIQEQFDEDSDVDRFVSNYQEAIDAALANAEYESAAGLINARSNNLISINQCALALSLLDEIDLGAFDTYNLAIVYANAMSTSTSCDDVAAEFKWSEAYNELTNRITNETE